MPFVLYASIAACWAFDDEDHPVAALALERVGTDEARVPSLWWFEVRTHSSEKGSLRLLAELLIISIFYGYVRSATCSRVSDL
jgi:hypothetical protein